MVKQRAFNPQKRVQVPTVLPYANTLTGIVAVLLVLREQVGSIPTARFVSVFTYGVVSLVVKPRVVIPLSRVRFSYDTPHMVI